MSTGRLGRRAVEVVERKGVGHPDVVADALAELISIAYSRYCIEAFGIALHHHVDKLLIHGGESRVTFGEVFEVRPVRIVISGRFTSRLGNQAVPVRELIEEVVGCRIRDLFGDRAPLVEIDHLYSPTPLNAWYAPESADALPDRQHAWAGDTAVVGAWWPLSRAERLALRLEALISSAGPQPRPDVGSDIKVMIVRQAHTFSATICIPFVASRTPSSEHYAERQNELQQEMLQTIRDSRWIADDDQIEIFINTSDANPFRDHPYLTPYGSAMGLGEQGVVGRANGIRQISATFRPSVLEASCGKNPVYHVGKVTALLAMGLSERLVVMTNHESEVTLATQNGGPTTPPYFVHASGGSDAGDLSEKMLSQALATTIENLYPLKQTLAGAFVPRIDAACLDPEMP